MSNYDNDSNAILRRELLKSVKLAKRRGYWFKLSRMERGLCSLALRLNVKFESIQFIRAIVSVLKKLKEAGNTLLSQLIRGARLAWLYSQAAVSWGNESAKEWRSDRKYIEFLGIFANCIWHS